MYARVEKEKGWLAQRVWTGLHRRRLPQLPLVSRYVTCKFVLRRNPSFLFCMLASFHRILSRFIPPSLPPIHGGQPIFVNALRDSCLVNRTQLKQLYSFCVYECVF